MTTSLQAAFYKFVTICDFQVRSRISGKGFICIKVLVCVWGVALLILSGLAEIKLFHFHSIFKTGGGGGGIHAC